MGYRGTYCYLGAWNIQQLELSHFIQCCHGAHRDGLNVRAAQSDNAQVSIEMGQGYDMDDEIEGLRSDVGRLKQVSPGRKSLAEGCETAVECLISAATPCALPTSHPPFNQTLSLV